MKSQLEAFHEELRNELEFREDFRDHPYDESVVVPSIDYVLPTASGDNLRRVLLKSGHEVGVKRSIYVSGGNN
jgi:hypothetical protein